MGRFLGWLSIIGGIVLGTYIGIWVLLIGGITQIINNLNPINALEIAIGIVRIMFCAVGWIPTYFGIVIGTKILEEM